MIVMFAYLHCDPSSTMITIPFVNFTLTWYGAIFATAFFVGLHIFIFMLSRFLRESNINYHDVAKSFGDKLIVYVIIATIIGARLGHVLFYESSSFYLKDPISIFKIWEGGLASHGGIVGVIVALFIFYRKNKIQKFTFLHLLDYMSVPTMFVCSMIRIGNFFNQEILGIETAKPWGLIFDHPKDGSLPSVRHPAMLYESVGYFIIFLSIFFIWDKYKLRSGKIFGLTLSFSFAFRFFIEYFKDEQSLWFNGNQILMGQLLSLPMIVIGVIFFVYKARKKSSHITDW